MSRTHFLINFYLKIKCHAHKFWFGIKPLNSGHEGYVTFEITKAVTARLSSLILFIPSAFSSLENGFSVSPLKG